MAPHPDRGRPEVDGFNPHLQPGRRFLSGLERRATAVEYKSDLGLR
jgi:hypothetical protein